MDHVFTAGSGLRRLRTSRLLMYALIGGLASLIDMGSFVLLHELAGLPALAAHSISVPASAAFSFVGNAWFNFETTDRLPGRIGSFAGVVVLGYLLGALVIWLFAHQTPLGDTVGKLVSLPLVFAFQFTLNSRISFRRHHAG